jgi:16S rRNA (cytidine1402-2'-O)-methyltransferase
LHSGTNARVSAALYVVATPIGNLRDITLRALDVLKAVAAVAAEDTRVTRHLLRHHGIEARLFSLHEHNEAQAGERVLELLRAGKPVALLSDAGTPAVSDPGARLVRRARQAGFTIVPIPGASAVTAAVSAAGLPEGRFLFYGFLPAKSAARVHELEALRTLGVALVFFEAPHRVREAIADLADVLGGERELVIARELTKLFETIHACRLGEALAWLDADPNRQKGEFVLVVQGAPAVGERQAEEGERVLAILLRELPLKQAVRLAAEIAGAKRNTLYARALALKGD